jgi:putative ABC transport system ATP-binding protein
VVLHLLPPAPRLGLRGIAHQIRWTALAAVDALFRRAGRPREERPRPELPPHPDAVHVRGAERLVLIPPGRRRHGKVFRLIAGLERPGRNQMTLSGHELHRLGEPGRARVRGLGLGAVSADVPLVPSLSVAENVALPGELGGGVLVGEVDRLLAAAGLDEVAGAYPHEIDENARHRALVTRALVRRPPVVLVDLLSFDPEERDALAAVLAELVPAEVSLILIDDADDHPKWIERSVHIHPAMVA